MSQSVSGNIYPLVGPQLGILFADQLSEVKNEFNVAHYIDIRAEIDIDVLIRAIELGVSETDTLHSQYLESQGQWFQTLSDSNVASQFVELYDFSQAAEPIHSALEWMQKECASSIDITQPDTALFRHCLIQVGNQEQPRWYWYQRYHHIAVDGFSFTAITQRIETIYHALVNERPLDPSPFISFTKVIDEHQAYQASDKYEQDKLFWLEYSKSISAPLRLSYRESMEKHNRVIRHSVSLTDHLLKPIAENLLPSETAMALVFAFLAQQTNSNHVTLGFPFMRRLGYLALNACGPVVNVLPVSLAISDDMNLPEIVRALKKELRSVKRHQQYEVEQIKRDIGKVNSALYGPILNLKLFDDSLNFGGSSAQTHVIATGPIDDIEFAPVIRNNQCRLELSASANLYTEQQLNLYAQRFVDFTQQWLEQPQRSLREINLNDKEAKSLTTCAIGPTQSPQFSSILNIFTEQVQSYPDRAALVCQNRTLTFKQLNQKVLLLAAGLKKQGVAAGDTLCVALERSENVIIAMLAVMRVGAVYLPLDANYPQERIRVIEEQSLPKACLVENKHKIDIQTPQWDIHELSCSDSVWGDEPFPDASSTAYILFTSGSTGKPKGVMIAHGALANLAEHHKHHSFSPLLARSSSPVRAAHTTAFVFDAAWEQILWMVWGNTLVIYDDEVRRDAFELNQRINEDRIDALDLSPSLFTQMLDAGLMEQPHTPTSVMVGSEAIPSSLWERVRRYPDLHVQNFYGPTEYTVDALSASFTDDDTPVIGRPITNTQVYVLDEQLKHVAVGVIGELYISGAGCAQGYLNQRAMTAERFVANPFIPGERMYRTGDLVRWYETGQLAYVGRSDDQIKVRGYRIELGDVERAFHSLPEVNNAVVVTEKHQSSYRLAAYCTLATNSNDTTETELLQKLGKIVPDYMVPSALLILDSFPLNVNGKIDRKSLPTIERQKDATPTGSQPVTQYEVALCTAVQTQLGIENIVVEDDFFAIGGDSISAMAITTQLRKSCYLLKAKDIFEKGTLKAIAETISQETEGEAKNRVQTDYFSTLSVNAISRFSERYGEVETILPTLPLQQGLVFQSQLAEEGNNYNSTTHMTFIGEFDAVRFQTALDCVIRKHPQLWARFDSDIVGESVQVLPRLSGSLPVLWPIHMVDLNSLPDDEQSLQLTEIAKSETARSFEINSKDEPLLHACVVHHHGNQHSVIISMHHLIVDGWSTPIFMNDFFAAYREGQISGTLKTRYAEVVNQLTARDKESARQLWCTQLEGAMPTLAYDGEANLQPIKEVPVKLDRQLTENITELCRREGLTLNSLMQGVWGVMLGLMTGKEDVIFGTPISGRFTDIEGIEEHIGLFTNSIPVRLAFKPHLSLIEQLNQVQKEQIQLLENDVLGLGEIQQIAGGDTLFDTMLSVENYPNTDDWFECQHAGLRLVGLDNRGYTHFPLTVFVVPGEQLEILVAYRHQKYDPYRLAEQLKALLLAVLEHPHRPLCQYQLLTENDSKLLFHVNHTAANVDKTTLRCLMRAQAKKTPNAIALCDIEHQLTYRDMRQQVSQLAQQLNQYGVRCGDIVAVALPRSVKLSIALNSTLEVGAAYLPLDVTYPTERLLYMVEDAKPSVIITTSEYRALYEPHADVIVFDELYSAVDKPRFDIDNNLRPQHGAYIIYTSGSTGNPKGVLVSHQAIVNRLLWMQNEYQLSESDVVLQKTPCSFDVSVWEFFWPLIQGARLMMAPPESHKDPDALLTLIEDYQVTTMHFVPSMLAAFMAYIKGRVSAGEAVAQSLKRVFCSGEALTKDLSQLYSEYLSAPLHNLYGPTEAAVDVTYCPAFGPALTESESNGVPIGLPVWNTQLRVLDSFLRDVPVGVPGELYLAGDQLAIGYLNRSALTADRFIADPSGNGQRMYRTGDVVRWLSSGKIDYLGRNDDQLKIRGQRIELGEIENCLSSLTGVKQAIVCAKSLVDSTTMAGADNRQLVGYVLSETPDLDSTHLRDAMKAHLPAHMVPIAIVVLDEFPLSANGKLDRKALPLPSVSGSVQGRKPEGELENQLAELFCSILERTSVSADDDFFALGGHSLLCMRLAAEIRQTLKRSISVGDIMVAPTVAGLAENLSSERSSGNKAGHGMVLPIRKGTGSPLFCINPASGFSWQYTGLQKYLQGSFPIIGLQSPREGGPIAECADMESACDQYFAQLRRIQPSGPYHLIGYSFGGNVAHTLAAKLEALGEKVSFVALFDTYPTEVQDWDAPLDLEEAEQEKALFMDADNGYLMDSEMEQEQAEMLRDIDANYDDAVGVMMSAITQSYSGRVHLFVADKTLPEFDIQQVWQPYVGEITEHHMNCRHQDILAPTSLTEVGPCLNALLSACSTLN
ncbi:amino acid adenylation domain-containing protein [Vibrio sp.]|nr:amino acid adenylation domain-containing protein [Vibrio sp.]